MGRPPGSPLPANALLDSALQPCKFLWVIAILQGLFTRFLWNMLVCTPAKLGGPYSMQAAYEELLLIALVHLQERKKVTQQPQNETALIT